MIAGTQGRIAVLDNDTDPDGDELQVVGIDHPQELALVLTPDGTIDCQVDHDVRGVFEFAYTISDGHDGIGTARVFVEVLAAVDMISRAWHGPGADDGSWLATIDGTGNSVAFASQASDLVQEDSNGVADIFVYEVASGSTRCISRTNTNLEANGASFLPTISASRRYVAFCSQASNLVPGDTNDAVDVFVFDRLNERIQRVSVSDQGAEAEKHCIYPAISADGRWVAFFSEAANLVPQDGNDASDVFVHDRSEGTTRRVSVASDGQEGNRSSGFPALSGDGRHISFQSAASNLVPGDTNASSDIFVHDCNTNVTRRVSGPGDGSDGNGQAVFLSALSFGGRYVVFQSMASNLAPADTNNAWDIFRYDLLDNSLRRVSVDIDGAQFAHGAVFPAVDATGRFVVFQSAASDREFGNPGVVEDIFLHDCLTGRTHCLSLSTAGDEAGPSYLPAISADGRFAVFESHATMVARDTNGCPDIFRVPNPAAL